MARLFSSGFELNSQTSGVEWSAFQAGGTIQSVTARSGTYAYKISGLSSGANQRARHQTSASSTNGPRFFRTYANFTTFPSAENRIIVLNVDIAPTTNITMYLTIDNLGVLRLYDQNGQISGTVTLSTGTWYRIEYKFDLTGGANHHIIEAKVDGSVFATSSTSNITVSGPRMHQIGGNLNSEAQTTGTWYFDDVAENDNTGSFQNDYPGPGAIKHLHPRAAGDANTFATQVGGTAGASNNFTRVKEVTPDDVTTYNGDHTLNDEDLFAFDASGIGASDLVKVVEVHGRYRNNVADATTALKFEIEKASAGTKSLSSALIPNSTTWTSSGGPNLLGGSIILYQDPDSSNWTQATLDTLQAGYKITTGGTNDIDISTLWVLIDTLDESTTTSTTSSSSSTSSTSSSSSSTSSTSSSTSSTSSSSSTSSTSSSTSSTSSSSSTSSTSSSSSTSSTSSSTSSTSSSSSTSSTSSSTSSTSSSSSTSSTSSSTSSTSSSSSTSSTSSSSSTSSTSSSTSSTSSSSSTSSTSSSTSSTSSSSSTSSTSSSTSSTSSSSSTSSTSSSTSSTSSSTSSTSSSTSSTSSSSSSSTSTILEKPDIDIKQQLQHIDIRSDFEF